MSASSALGARTTAEEAALVERQPTQNLQAWNLYRQGRYHEMKVTPESLHRAVDARTEGPASDAFVAALDNSMWTASRAVTSWPTADLFGEFH